MKWFAWSGGLLTLFAWAFVVAHWRIDGRSGLPFWLVFSDTVVVSIAAVACIAFAVRMARRRTNVREPMTHTPLRSPIGLVGLKALAVLGLAISAAYCVVTATLGRRPGVQPLMVLAVSAGLLTVTWWLARRASDQLGASLLAATILAGVVTALMSMRLALAPTSCMRGHERLRLISAAAVAALVGILAALRYGRLQSRS